MARCRSSLHGEQCRSVTRNGAGGPRVRLAAGAFAPGTIAARDTEVFASGFGRLALAVVASRCRAAGAGRPSRACGGGVLPAARAAASASLIRGARGAHVLVDDPGE